MFLRNLNVVRYLFHRSFVRHICVKSLNMPYIAVRRAEGEERLQMTFSLSLHEKPVRTFNFDRSCEEAVGATLQRISANVQKRFMKKKKKKKGKDGGASAAAAPDDENYVVELFHRGGEKVEAVTLNGDAWCNGSTLRIAGTDLDVAVNLPTIKSIEFPSSLMSGFPVFPKLETEFIDKWSTQFVWYKGGASGETSKSPETPLDGQASTSKDQTRQDSNTNWIKVGEGSSYTPSNDDIGASLKLVATPIVDGRKGAAVEISTKETIGAGPGFCPFENRHMYTKKLADDDSIRVVSYNILADTYADSDFSREHLYPYCPPYALAIDYRRQLLIKEILGYNADLVCLQEVDRKVFDHELQPVMESAGLDGRQLLKRGETPEGCAVFFRKSKFKVLGEHNVSVSEELKTAPENEALWAKVLSVEPLCERVVNKNTCLQVLVLESTVQPGQTVCVATTHLYFHPNANHVRLIQGAVCMNHVAKVMTEYKQKGINPALILCGDLNSCPNNGLIQFVNEKHIAADDPKWFPSDSPKEENCGGTDLSHPFDLISACGTPDFTNYVGGFQGCLDYIFVDKTKFDVSQVVPLPSLQEVTQYIALPNVVFPSDHLALVCDVQWKKDGNSES